MQIKKISQSSGVVATVVQNTTSTSQIDVPSVNAVKDSLQKHIVTANQSGRPTLNIGTTYGTTKMPFDGSDVIGTKLTFDNANDRIVVGSGVSKVKVSGKMNVWSTPAAPISEVDSQIKKNTTTISACLQSRITGMGFNDEVLSEKSVTVSSGDYIEMWLLCSSSGNYAIIGDGNATYLTVEVVE